MTDVPNTGPAEPGPLEARPPAAADRLRRLTAAAQSGDPAAQSQLADALFRSELRPGAQTSPEDVREAIRRAMLRDGGTACAPPAATGTDPGEVDARMRWCRNVVALSYCAIDSDGSDPASGEATGDQESAYLRDLFWRRA